MMHSTRTFAALLLITITLAVAGGAWGHGVEVFATYDGSEVHGKAQFADGAPLAGVDVNVLTAEGEPVAVVTTDDNGDFVYRPDRAGEHRFIVETLDGHRAEFSVDLSGGEQTEEIQIEIESEGILDDAIRRAVAEEVAPLREQINSLENRIGLRDVIGGIGFIVGIFGLLAILKTRGGGEGS